MISKYIEWRYTKSEIVDKEDILNKIAELDKLNAVQPTTKTKKADWYIDRPCYNLDVREKWQTLYYVEIDEFGIHTPARMLCNKYKSKTEYAERAEAEVSSVECRQTLLNKFKEDNNTTMLKAFGVTHAKDFRCFVPKPTYYIDRDYAFHNIPGVQYIDVSAMYPAKACGLLPDYHTAMTVSGRVEPDETYRFAFYVKSNHCAEYGVFDTHDYLKLPPEFRRWQLFTDRGKPIYNHVSDEDEITILMKASNYKLDSVMQSVWNDRFSDDPVVKSKAKRVSNIGIGTLHRNPETYGISDMTDYYHVAAVILGRANKLQYDMIRKIKQSGGLILQVIVDSIIYIGKENYGGSKKTLGEYYNEFGKTVTYRCNDRINKYVIFDEEKILKCVVSGVKDAIVNKPEDIDNF